MKILYAMTFYNLQEHQETMEILLQSLLKASADKDILAYKKTIEFYSVKLDETWK